MTKRPRKQDVSLLNWRYAQLSSAIRASYGQEAHSVILQSRFRRGSLETSLSVHSLAGEALLRSERLTDQAFTRLITDLENLLGQGVWLLCASEVSAQGASVPGWQAKKSA